MPMRSGTDGAKIILNEALLVGKKGSRIEWVEGYPTKEMQSKYHQKAFNNKTFLCSKYKVCEKQLVRWWHRHRRYKHPVTFSSEKKIGRLTNIKQATH
jgi:hypothetical protein